MLLLVPLHLSTKHQSWCYTGRIGKAWFQCRGFQILLLKGRRTDCIELAGLNPTPAILSVCVGLDLFYSCECAKHRIYSCIIII